jgi:hypothetical protein
MISILGDQTMTDSQKRGTLKVFMITQYTDIRAVRPIDENIIDEKRLKPYLEEAETLYLLPVTGAAFYRDISELKCNKKTAGNIKFKAIGK